ncbi:MAG: hypothetical protein ACI9LX_002893 [Paraglaciecola sp.]
MLPRLKATLHISQFIVGVESSLVRKKIIINASAAKYGGAKTIIESFIGWIGDCDDQTQFILMAPQKPEPLPTNVHFVRKETSGISTLLFSCLGIFWFCLKYRVSHCISFNNVNLVLPICRRITYFHQAKVFTEKSLRFRLIALAIHLLKESTIVVQSPLIQQRFAEKFSKHYKLLVKWPGVKPEVAPHLPVQIDSNKQNELVVLWPVTDPNVSQKNLDWFYQHNDWLVANRIKLLVTSEQKLDLPNAVALGQISRAQLFDLYQRVDAVLIVSIEETLCLPIFEAASLGAKVIVLNMPYIQAIKEWRGLPQNVQLFDTVGKLNLQPNLDTITVSPIDNYFMPDWLIY